MTSLGPILAHLEALRAGEAGDPDRLHSLHGHVVDEWIATLGLSRRQVCDVVSAWLAFGFDRGRLSFEFADLVANDLYGIAQATAPVGTYDILDFHTPLSWEVYLAFDAGEFSSDPGFEPVEGNTRPLIRDIVGRIDDLAEYPAALAPLRAWFSATSGPAATS